MVNGEIYATALKSALEEMQNVCPDIQHAFIFNESGEVVVGDANIPQKVMVHVVDAFDDVLERAEAIGGVEAVTLNCREGNVKLYHFNEHYFVMVVSAKADANYVDTVTRVLFPTVLRLLEKISPTPLKNETSPPKIESKPETLEAEQSYEKLAEEEPAMEFQGELNLEPPHETPFEIPSIQLIVENIGGLLVPSDTVRIDNETLSQWESTFEGKKIEYVEIETFNGKTERYKVKPIKDSKYYGKGVVQVPEKAQLSLEIKKGELVKVKPIIE
ncbi:MAG: hypothetical protein ACUVTE_00895 [Candidatus Bathycorpusculaceae bacterium]